MILQKPIPQYKPLKRLSPSQAYGAFQCPYKMVLAAAFDFKPLVPLSPQVYFGAVLHSLMELIAKRVITSDSIFEYHWKSEIEKKEQWLVKEGLSKFVPLKNHIKDIGLKKLQVKSQIKTTEPEFNISPVKVAHTTSEMPLADKIGQIYGKADLVIEYENFTIIYDFKTGQIHNNALSITGNTVSHIKEEYEYQLKLYAQLYAFTKNKYPDKLYLVPVNGKRVEVQFTEGDCAELYAQALDRMKEINAAIEGQKFDKLSNCSESNCKYCMFRPACPVYLDQMETGSFLVNDVTGNYKGCKVFPNGNACIYLETKKGEIIVSGMDKNCENIFKGFNGKKLILYNIKKEKNSSNVITTKYTAIYECE